PAANSSVVIAIEVPGQTTQARKQGLGACYDQVIRELGARTNMRGFSSGKNKRIPPQLIVNHFGPEIVKGQALEKLTETAIKQAIEQSGVKPIGQASLLSEPTVLVQMYTPGEAMQVEVRVDVWPDVKWTGDYTKLIVEADDAPFDQERYNSAMTNLRERCVELKDTAEDYAAADGDSVIVDMVPYEELSDGSRGDALPQFASGEQVEIVLSGERYMPGLVEGLLGAKAGDVREVRVSFPERMPGQAAALAGKKAIFEVKVAEVKSREIPGLTDEFANSIRPGLSMAELEKEVIAAVNDEGITKKTENRNRALEAALLTVAEVSVPETLIFEQAKNNFAIMMSEMREQQGTDDEELKKMVSKE
ncbi:unnamed protein product, partial [Phaeothamnion confervicola]